MMHSRLLETQWPRLEGYFGNQVTPSSSLQNDHTLYFLFHYFQTTLGQISFHQAGFKQELLSRIGILITGWQRPFCIYAWSYIFTKNKLIVHDLQCTNLWYHFFTCIIQKKRCILVKRICMSHVSCASLSTSLNHLVSWESRLLVSKTWLWLASLG